MEQQPETHDIQGIIIRGYKNLPAADFLLLKITNPVAAKQWLKTIIPQLTTGAQKPKDFALNIALTYEGLKNLGLNASSLDSFPMELQDGMTTSHKQLFLGDYGASDSANWEWGGKKAEPIHFLLMLYAMDARELNTRYTTYQQQLSQNGLTEIKKLDTSVLVERKEHFGFHDGIAQPIIRGLSKEEVPDNTINAGEFILGYKNEYGQYPESPVDNNRNDIGKNGSYLVFRQLKQDVGLFWKYMHQATCFPDGACNVPEMIKLAAKMTGRWPSGAPLVDSPDKDDKSYKNADHFNYRHDDSGALKCPVGSHIRRSNPRDSIEGSAKKSIEVANKHRILRRGRSYGLPLVPSMNPEEIIQVKDTGGERGLHFICFNADISRQFEFIQNNWVNNPKFDELYDERDPITGNHSNPNNLKNTGTFTDKEEHIRRRHTDVPEFIQVKGGAYFFMPGIKALNHISSI